MACRAVLRYATLLLGVGAAVFFGQTHADEPSPNDAARRIKQEFAAYKTWKLVAEKEVPRPFFGSCSPERSERSPHDGRYIRVYASPQGQGLFAKFDAQQFPENTVIVKEKLRQKGDDTPLELGVMIKRKPGSSPATQDWQYAFIDRAGESVTGAQLEKCARCHSAARADSVFGAGK